MNRPSALLHWVFGICTTRRSAAVSSSAWCRLEDEPGVAREPADVVRDDPRDATQLHAGNDRLPALALLAPAGLVPPESARTSYRAPSGNWARQRSNCTSSDVSADETTLSEPALSGASASSYQPIFCGAGADPGHVCDFAGVSLPSK